MTTAPDFWKTIGIPQRGKKLHDQLHAGLSYAVYKRLAREVGLEQKELAHFVAIPSATLQRRAGTGRFKLAESDGLYRFAEVFKAALDLFEGDIDATRNWLTHSVRGLGGRRPADMLVTWAETEAVFDPIGRLEHGAIV